ncbi:MAG: hypothetical protein CRN43_14000, partial [Candidatus Nephrothrix sp. EaCA]
SILLGLIALLYGAETKAQFNEGDKLLNVGAGVAATYGGVPLFLTYEQQAFHRNISVGGATGYQSWTQDYALIGSKGSIDYTSYLLGIRASYHLNEALNVKVEELDLYLGLGLVYRGYSSTVKSSLGIVPSTHNSGLRPLVHFGGRYYLHKNIAIYLEGGWSGFSVLQSG